MPLVTGIRHRAFALGVAGVIEYGLQALLPVILVRHLDAAAFGDYRLVWLVGTTGLALFTLAIPQSLFYFLPRADSSGRRRVIGNSFYFLAFSGLLAGATLVAFGPLLPSAVAGLDRYSGVAPIFLGLWVLGSLLDVLPTADGRAEWQARSTIALAMFRTIVLAAAAVMTRDGSAVLWFMCVFAFTKVCTVLLYANGVSNDKGILFDKRQLILQIKYAFPFALAGGLFALRTQADQWVVAASFPPTAFALISLATVVLGISTLIRQPVTRAILPKFSALVGAGDLEQARLLLAKGYPAVAFVLMPAMGLVFVAAKELVEIIYTRNYVEAAPIMQIYLVGQMANTFEAGYLLIAINRGKLAASIHGVCLILAVILSLIGIKMFGLNGAAAGSVICVFIAELWALFAVAHALEARPVDIVRFSITARIVLVTVLAVVATLFVRHALEFKIDLGWMLAVESLAYFLCLAVFMWIFGLYQHGLNTVTTFFKRREA